MIRSPGTTSTRCKEIPFIGSDNNKTLIFGSQIHCLGRHGSHKFLHITCRVITTGNEHLLHMGNSKQLQPMRCGMMLLLLAGMSTLFKEGVCEDVHRCLSKQLQANQSRTVSCSFMCNQTFRMLLCVLTVQYLTSLGFSHMMPSLHLAFIYLHLLQCTVAIWIILHLFVC